MGWLTLFIKHKCPFCNSPIDSLRYYTIESEGGFLDVGDYVPNNLDSDIGFITADGYCDYCEKSYMCKVGIKKSRLTNVIIFNKEINRQNVRQQRC